MKKRHWLTATSLLMAILFFITSFGTAFASTRVTSQAAVPQVNVSGTWNFTTTDPDYPSFQLVLQQNGTILSGHDESGQPVHGMVHRKSIKFHVVGVSSEDDYGGHGSISNNGSSMQGPFWDGFGGTGTFKGTKVG